MKRYVHAFAMCQSMFCAIASPWQIWDEQAKDKMLLFLPAVGLEIGAIWTGIFWLCRLLKLPSLVTGIILCAYLYLVTGFMHLDGFMDVTDAVKSWRDLERRREILKDSHVGSFSVIGCALLITAQFSFLASLSHTVDVWLLTMIPVVSRCCSSLAVIGLKPMSTSQYANQKKSVPQMAVLTVLLCMAVGLGFALWGRYGFVFLIEILGYALALRRAYRSLKGMNGDIAGYALTLSELTATAVLVLI